MKTLAQVRSDAKINVGMDNIMRSKPAISSLVAECIALWAEIETVQGCALAFILGAEAKAGIAMFQALKADAAQSDAMMAAAKALLPERESVLLGLLIGHTRTAAKPRNWFAHWCWASSPDLPDVLLLMEPKHRTDLMARILKPKAEFKVDPCKVKVVTESEAFGAVKRAEFVCDDWVEFVSLLRSADQAERDRRYAALSTRPHLQKPKPDSCTCPKSNPPPPPQ